MAKNEQSPEVNQPIWFDGKSINEALFCDDFLNRHKIIYTNGAFFTPDGRVTTDLPLRSEIFDELRCCAVSNIPRKISNIVELMKLAALLEDFPPEADRIHLANGTLFLDGTFTEGKPEIVRCRLPVAYNPNAHAPTSWLAFLDGLLYPEDIPTLQEFIGYCLIPSNKGQRMMVIKGNGGEGKSQIGAVLSALFGSNMKDGSIGKISENRFARADLEHILLCVDDDMRMEALRQTNYVKSIVTAQGKMDLERKGKQSYQGWMCARLLAFSNGDLQALFDRSDGFYPTFPANCSGVRCGIGRPWSWPMCWGTMWSGRNGGKRMTDAEKKLLQAKHRMEEAQARDRVKERKARTRRLIQEGAILEKAMPEVRAMELSDLETYLLQKR